MIVTEQGIDTNFLADFRKILLQEIKRGRRFVLTVGGGMTARQYMRAAARVLDVTDDDRDWLGIHATRLNAHLLRTVFRDVAHPVVVKNPMRAIRAWKEPVLLAAGWRPGRSTDDIAVRMAKKVQAQTVINVSNVAQVFDRDPHTHADAVPFTRMSWRQFREIVGEVWDPGANVPFDPVAAKYAHRHGIEVRMVSGKDLEAMRRAIAGQSFTGTIIIG